MIFLGHFKNRQASTNYCFFEVTKALLLIFGTFTKSVQLEVYLEPCRKSI